MNDNTKSISISLSRNPLYSSSVCRKARDQFSISMISWLLHHWYQSIVLVLVVEIDLENMRRRAATQSLMEEALKQIIE